ncbi:glycoside hydrolase superfamily [Mycena maculata]|uniref:Glycoside hydrolase superfamily n=1 Tax=Mycena maculata TaxID=230809 RepID=A0AAD7IV53_9AGAR|nr:glycoside hydrolase superfamily [Mycena maculata]
MRSRGPLPSELSSLLPNRGRAFLANALARPPPTFAHDVIVKVILSLRLRSSLLFSSQLFEWPWESVATECTNFLGLDRLGMDARKLAPQWNTLRATSGGQTTVSYYILTSKRGNRAHCNEPYDIGSGVGFAGSSYTKYSYPAVPYSSSNFRYCSGNGEAAEVTDLNNVTDVHFCELDGLADLAQEQPAVQDALTAYLEDLVSLGISGFRVDAAVYMEPANLSAIYSALKGSPIGDTRPDEHRVGPHPFERHNFIIANQDTERSSSPSDSLNYLSPNNAYVLGAIFLLGFNYGMPTVYAGYDYSMYSQTRAHLRTPMEIPAR